MKKNLYLIGAGGHCKSCIDVIESTAQYEIRGLFDNSLPLETDIMGYKVIGSDEKIKEFISSKNYFLITVGQIKTAEIRKKIQLLVESLGGQFATVISPRAYVSRSAKIELGTIVMHDALVNSAAVVGKHCILNTKSLVEHDVVVEDFCHISTGAVLNGMCVIGSESFIGSNSVLQEKVTINKGSLLMAGQFHRNKLC